MNFSVIEALLLFVVIQLLFFTVFFWHKRSKLRISSIMLSLFFFSLAINIFNLFLINKADTLPAPMMHTMLIGAPFAYLYAPFFYLYIKSVINKLNFRFWYTILHFLPFIVYVGWLFFNFYLFDAETKREIIVNQSLINQRFKIAYTLLLQIQVLTYLILGHRLLNIFRTRIEQYYSNFNKLQLNWITRFLIILSVIYVTDLIRFIFLATNSQYHMLTELILFIFLIAMCYWLIYNAISKPVVLIPENISNITSKEPNSLRIKYKNMLIEYMSENKPYLNPDISLEELAKATSIPIRTLSEIINKELEKTFYDFINSYRIDEAMQLLANTDQQKTILEILYEVGFNSKSSFNTFFKKQMGMTPSQYKRSVV